jgi:DNA replication and repair protein RecF
LANIRLTPPHAIIGEPQVPFPLSVARLALTQFRCHEQVRLELPAAPVVLTGANGAGKTSILEALSLLAPGRGLRRARLGELARHDGHGHTAAAWTVTTRLQTSAGLTDVAMSWTGDDGSGERRLLRLDGQPARSQAALAGIVSVMWLTPDMDRLFTEGASARRRFLDRLVYGLDPGHAARAAAYDRALQQRSALLRQGRADRAWLAALEDSLATTGVAIVAARRDAAARLSAACRNQRGPFPAAVLQTAGIVEDWLDAAPALAVEERLRAALAASRASDAETGGAAVGAHRGDLVVRHAASGRAAASCSTGEQKTLLIAIVLAAAALHAADGGRVPLLLLDEVAAHLDAGHRHALFDAVADLGAQAWYAGTDRLIFAPLRGRAHFVPVGGSPAAEPAGG